MRARVACVALVFACACAGRPRAATTATAPTKIDLFRNNRAVIELHQNVALHAGSQELRIALPGRPAKLDVGKVQTTATLVSWHLTGESEQAAPTLALTLSAPRAGNYDVTVHYVVDVQPWHADYRVIMQPAAGQALLDASLVLDLPFGLPTGNLVVHDSVQAADAATNAGFALGIVELPAGVLRVPLLARHTLRATPHVTVDFASPDDARGLAMYSTEPEADRTLTAAVTYEVAAGAPALAHAPQGSATVYVQTGQTRPVRAAQLSLFEGAERQPSLRIPLSEVATIIAHRHRSEFAYLASRHRVVEQFDFEISNQADVATTVTIADRATRGTEWWLGYVNADHVAKTPGTEQDFSLQVQVPAHKTRKAMYRIVYSGSQL